MPGRFLCDRMLLRLARWLRAAGYDTTVAGAGDRDRDILADAVREGRLLVTCDRGLARHRYADGTVVVISGDGLSAQTASLQHQVAIDWQHAPLSRCLVCNETLRPAEAAAGATVPAGVYGPVRTCPTCRRLYWAGGHETRIRRTLASLAAGGGPGGA